MSNETRIAKYHAVEHALHTALGSIVPTGECLVVKFADHQAEVDKLRAQFNAIADERVGPAIAEVAAKVFAEVLSKTILEKAYPLQTISPEEQQLVRGVANGLGMSYDEMANEILRKKVKELEALPTSLPDNLISHRRAWLSGLERVAELEPLTTVHEEDTRGYWKHELTAMHDMYADLDRKMAEPYPFTEPLSLTSARGIPLRLEFDPAEGQSMWLEGGCRTGESEEDFIRIDTIENAEAIAQHLLGWVRAERARRVVAEPGLRKTCGDIAQGRAEGMEPRKPE